jgi:1-acyl-sn-glycerol-3-phosphate acyltransferase
MAGRLPGRAAAGAADEQPVAWAAGGRPGWRPMRNPARLSLYHRIVAGLARLGVRVIARVHVEGLEHVPASGPLIVVANHMSNADPPFLWGWLVPVLGRVPTYLAKAVLFRGVAGTLLRSVGATPVEAGGSDMAAYRVAKAALDAGGVVTLMPEGTRSRDGRLQDAHPGASLLATRTGATVLPVGISNTDELLGRGRSLPRFRTRVTLRVGRPFTLTLEGGDRRAAIAAADAQVMRRIAALVDPRHRGAWEPWPDS